MVSPDNPSRSPLTNKPKITESEIILRRVLKSSPQCLWLDTIRRARGAENDGLIYWMLNQTECDFAIAVHAFYRSNPAQHLDDPRPLPARPSPSTLFALVLLNWDTGSYRTHRLKVQDIDADPRQIARINQKIMARPRGTLPFTIPTRFLEPVGGAIVPLPPHMSPDEAWHLWPLYDDLNLDVPNTPPGIRRKIANVKAFLRNIRRRTGLL